MLPLRVVTFKKCSAPLAKEFRRLKILAGLSSRFTIDLPKAIKSQIEEWRFRGSGPKLVFPVTLNLFQGWGHEGRVYQNP
jgi:hypothetical protein